MVVQLCEVDTWLSSSYSIDRKMHIENTWLYVRNYCVLPDFISALQSIMFEHYTSVGIHAWQQTFYM